jgi:hypothetical protein
MEVQELEAARIEAARKEWRDQAIRFQDHFREFLSSKDDLEECGHLAKFLAVRYWGNPPDTINRRAAREDLEVLRCCLTFVSECAVGDLVKMPRSGRSEAQVEAEPLLQILSGLRESASSINALCEVISQSIEQTRDMKNINWNAVDAVSDLRAVWSVMFGKDAPSRALNPSSKFASFLHVGFKYLGLDADPASAFKRWSATADPSEKK